MSRILWIEDFEGNKYREFSSALFSDSLSISPDGFPDSRKGLRDLLAKKNVILETTYREASRYINKSLRGVDAVIIDIDLDLYRNLDFPDQNSKLKDYLGEQTWSLLKRWHGFDPDLNDPGKYENSFNEARREMKKIAGYHLFVDLVFNKRFPKEHIIFASNHFEYIKSIPESFEKAKINPPRVFSKDKPDHLVEIKKWISEIRGLSYLRFRRWVLEGCEYCLDRLKTDSEFYALRTLDKSHVVITLESLPHVLPEHFINDDAKASTYRVLARVLSQAFEEKFDAKTLDPCEKAWPRLSYFWTLKNCRNWTSHDSNALTTLEESDVIFFFLIAMRFFFKLGNKLAKYETELFEFLGPRVNLYEEKANQGYQISFDKIRCRCSEENINPNSPYFSYLANNLQIRGKLATEEMPRILYQACFSGLLEPFGGQVPSLRLQQEIFVEEMMSRAVTRSFGG